MQVHIFLSYHGDFSAGNTVFQLYLGGLVVFGYLPLGSYTAPISKDRVPNSDVSDMTILLSDVAHCCFQTTRKPSFGCFKLHPSVVKLVPAFSVE
jgi:hypothetical protein